MIRWLFDVHILKLYCDFLYLFAVFRHYAVSDTVLILQW